MPKLDTAAPALAAALRDAARGRSNNKSASAICAVSSDDGGGGVQEQLAELTARFRPNIVIRGARPYAEDHWRAICAVSDDSGEVMLRLKAYKPCNRCGVVNVHTVRKRWVCVGS